MLPLKERRAFPVHDHDEHDFEDHLRSVNPFEFELMKTSRRVCLIRRDEGPEATGFLVGPDLMLTAAHALLGTSGIFADPEDVTVLFDQFIWNRRTGTKAWGAQCKLRHIPFERQPDVLASSIKTDPKSRRRAKAPHDDNGLDYVLVRLDQPVGLMYLPFSHRIRGWNDCSKSRVPARGIVRVVQHPFGGLQKFADGKIKTYDRKDPDLSLLYSESDDQTLKKFFKYTTETLNGSSGSPIYNKRNIVVGMHIGELSEKRQLGVSFQEIAKDLENEGVKLPPFPPSKQTLNRLFGTSTIEWERRPQSDKSAWHGDRLFD